MSRQQAQAAMQRAQAGDQRIESLSSELTFALPPRSTSSRPG